MATSADMVGSGFLPGPDDAGRDTDGNRIVREVPGHHCASSHNAPVANSNTRGHNHPGSKPHIASDSDVALIPRLLPEGLSRFKLVIRCSNKNLGSQGHKIPDQDFTSARSGPETAALTDVAVMANANALSEANGNIRCHSGAGTDRHQRSLLNMAVAVEMDEPKKVDV